MRILVVCGAGASSTFVAMRLRHAAADRGIDLQALAGTEASLPVDLDQADILLVGPHLGASLERIEAFARERGVTVLVLPDAVFGDTSGLEALELILSHSTEAAVTSAPSANHARDTKGTHHG